ncbi:homologous recombination OB-fold protein isoform X2 [Solea solea]|uniref:homologous recombination OB-fold protein isoform X2 n=1 Tax=Solea solea TaxID=90069 RepID=UPI002729BA67|nr:homologous recombination OB-fold protein isoform X2 [Solea solea]
MFVEWRSIRDHVRLSSRYPMSTMSCKINGLFSTGEDFDDEDLLGTDWTVRPASGGADAAAADVSSCVLRPPSVVHREPVIKCLQQSAQGSAALCKDTALRSRDTPARQTFALGLRQLSSSSSQSPSTLNNTRVNVVTLQSHANTGASGKPCVAQDDFDEWDVDLADLDESECRMAPPLQAPPPTPPATTPAFSTKTLRPPTCGGIQTQPNRTHNLPPQTLLAAHVRPAVPRPTLPLAPPQSPCAFPGRIVTSPTMSPISRTLIRPQQPQRLMSTPGPSPQPHGIFETISPSPSSSSLNSSILSPHPLHTTFLTNRLVQLVSASNKFPKKRPRSELLIPRTRRFPGPAGLLPQQPQGHSLDDIVVSVPHTPAHGVVARLPSQVSSSQNEEDEFSGGAWAAMKTEMGLDERNPSCFLSSYSVVMVLRKAALKQLAKNKVPNMAVLLKSIIHTHADAKAVFKDPTGEIQGTVHRRLLEDRAEELKVGAVLLLKQVGVFSPSHRNHYLNVTANNLLRVYNSDGVSLSSTQLPPLVLEPMLPSPTRSTNTRREPISRMQLLFDEEDDEGQEAGGSNDPQAPSGTQVTSSKELAGNPGPQDPAWDADDDLDELLGELPEDTYSL